MPVRLEIQPDGMVEVMDTNQKRFYSESLSGALAVARSILIRDKAEMDMDAKVTEFKTLAEEFSKMKPTN